MTTEDILVNSMPTKKLLAEASALTLMATSKSDTLTIVCGPLATSSPSTVMVISEWGSVMRKMAKNRINTLGITLMALLKSVPELFD